MTRKAESETQLTSSANTQKVQYSLQGNILQRRQEGPYVFTRDRSEKGGSDAPLRTSSSSNNI